MHTDTAVDAERDRMRRQLDDALDTLRRLEQQLEELRLDLEDDTPLE